MDVDGEGGLFAEVLDIGGRPSNLNIGDVIEAISAADPDAAVALDEMAQPPQPEPYVHIVEQPASKALRFRYECEGRSAGSIPGVNSTTEHKTFPTIEVGGYAGRAIIVVSCVTRDEPYKPHPHNLVGRERCRNGVCTMKVDLVESARVSFSNLGIQCVKRRDIAEALNVRESQRVDPFKTGFAHKQQPQSIDLNAVRLCFQVFLLNGTGRHTITLPPVVSEVIYDKKAMSDLQITRISRPSGYARGGNEIILLCEKVTREDISVVLVDETAGWEAAGNVIIVHKQVAIAFTTPAYRDPNTRDHVQVQIQLKRISDGARSNSVSFTYIPDTQEPSYLRSKFRKRNLIQDIEQEQKASAFLQEPAIKAEPGGSEPRYGDPQDVYQPPQWIDQLGLPGGALPVAAGGYYQVGGWPPQPTYGQPVPQPMQARSPLAPAASPLLAPSPHRVQAMSPVHQANLHAMSPGQVMSPGHQVMSPGHQVMSPGHQVMSPGHQGMSPGHQGMSPGHQVMSPGHPVMSPAHQVMSPVHQVMSPGQVMSPNHPGQVMSPNHPGHVMSPGQAMSPGVQAMSPHPVMSPHMAMETDRGYGISQLGQMNNVPPQYMGQVPQQQEMESSNSISLSNLLNMDPGDQGILLNSGELSNLSALLGSAESESDFSKKKDMRR